MKESTGYVKEFEEHLNSFVKELKNYVSTDDGEWTIKGFIDVYKNIFTISSDTKIVSKILEIHIFPAILKFATQSGYKIVLADHQNWYPDLTLIKKDDDSVKFALDLKTTFRRSNKAAGFTLGSHGGYFKDRNKSKNIQYPYNDYSGHYCLGVIYSRTDFDNDLAEMEIFHASDVSAGTKVLESKIGARDVTTVDELTSISSVIKDFEFFAAAKWRIASDSRGSGNTANIGSIKNIEDLKNGKGVFHQLGEDWFDEYWMNYGSATIIKNGNAVQITNIWDFLTFKGREDLFDKVGLGAKRKK